jgi:hypothetical protein
MSDAGRIRDVMVQVRRAALAVALGSLALGAQAAPFSIITDGPDSVWVLDAASGALDWCRLEPQAGPKVIDVFGFEATQRLGTPRTPKPECAEARAPERVEEWRIRLLRFGHEPHYGDDNLRYSQITARPVPPVMRPVRPRIVGHAGD